MNSTKSISVCVVICMFVLSVASHAQVGLRGSSFVDERGVTTLTNRPEFYQGEGGYLEIALDYEPI